MTGGGLGVSMGAMGGRLFIFTDLNILRIIHIYLYGERILNA